LTFEENAESRRTGVGLLSGLRSSQQSPSSDRSLVYHGARNHGPMMGIVPNPNRTRTHILGSTEPI